MASIQQRLQRNYYIDRIKQIAWSRRQTTYEDELNALATAVVLGKDRIIAEGFLILDVSQAKKVMITSLEQLQIGRSYLHSEVGTTVLRRGPEVVVGGKISIPVNLATSPDLPTMRGELKEEAMTAALENFLTTKVSSGLLLLEQDKSLAKIFFTLKDVPRGSTYVSNDAKVVLRRNEDGLFEFTFRGSTDGMSDLPRTPQSEKVMRRLGMVAEGAKSIVQPKKLEFTDKSEKENLLNGAFDTPEPSPDCEKRRTPIINLGTPILAPQLAKQKQQLEKEDVPLIEFSPIKATQSQPLIDLSTPPSTPLTRVPATPIVPVELPLPTTSVQPASYDGVVLPPPPPPPMMSIPKLPPPPGLPMPKLATANSKKLRPLHWAAIPKNQLQNTIFSELSPLQLHEDTEKDLESLFSTSPVRASEATPSRRPLPAKKNISLLDLRKSNNAGIVLAQFKLSFDDIRAAVYNDVLETDQLIALKSLFPLTDLERKILTEYKGPLEDLAKAEQFYRQVLSIPRFEQRIESFLFKKQFEGFLTELNREIGIIRGAAEQMQNCEKLRDLLKLILAVGQVLNRNTYLSAGGFKLNSLIKLAETKAKTQATSLLDYVIRQAAANGKEHLFELFKDLSGIFDAQKYEIGFVATEFNDLRQGLRNLEKEITFFSTGDIDSQFQTAMQPFYNSAMEQLALLETTITTTREKFEKVCLYFGENPTETNCALFFGPLAAFAETYAKSVSAYKRSPLPSVQ